MSAPILSSMPDVIRAGETIQYTRSVQDYLASDGWTLAVALRGIQIANGTVTTNANGKDFDVVFSAAMTGALAAGNYQWLERVTKAGESHDVGNSVLVVLQNLITAAAGDGQTLNEKLLALVETRLSGRITEDMEQFSIAGRAISRIPFEELLKIRTSLRFAVWQDANPNSLGRTVKIAFPGPELRP